MKKIKGLAALTAVAMNLHGISSAAAAVSGAEILDLQGKGEQRPNVESIWSAAKTKQTLSSGAYVRTGAASRMALLFSDQTQIRLHENSVLQIKGIATPARPLTTLAISAGRAWMQTKRAGESRLQLESPAATAAIRGTDWEFDVDPSGKTMLTVLSGTVEFFNEQGRVSVGKNEAAIAEVGKAPVKIQLSNPRDRIQWVNALTADPMRHIRTGDLSADLIPVRAALAKSRPQDARMLLADKRDSMWSQVLLGASDVLSGDLEQASRKLSETIANSDNPPAAAYLILSDIELVSGKGDAAAKLLEGSLQKHPGQPDLQAQLARAHLLSDRLEESERVLAQVRETENVNVLLSEGQLARRKGDTTATLSAYGQAVRAAPQDDRAWFGLGSAQTELEDTKPARQSLLKALELNDDGAGYRSELGVLDTFTNRFADAEQSFDAALAQNPADYVALTGQGLLRLKQGRPEEALDAFLRAGVMEPRYARAKTYTAVAYYQLGRHQDAISTLMQATELDDKDPVPYMFLSQIYTDLFRPSDAVQASQEAVKRLPYLKSLNQLANDQKGSANLGASLAFFGMEDWALEIAQQSYYPYWGGSHLFLADRYPGEFNKNSKLFQGFLTDPLVFGSSNRYSSLLQRAGNYGAVDGTYDKESYELLAPAVTLNGLNNSSVPVSYFVQHQNLDGRDFPLDFNSPGTENDEAEVDANVTTVGLGMQATERVNIFTYLDDVAIKLDGRNDIHDVLTGASVNTKLKNTARNNALGWSYRWSPSSQTWFKVGNSSDRTELDNLPASFVEPQVEGSMNISGRLRKKSDDLQLRHTMDLSSATRISVGLDHTEESQNNDVVGTGQVEIGIDPNDPSLVLPGLLAFRAGNRITRRFDALTLSGRHDVSSGLTLDSALTFNRVREKVAGSEAIGLFTQFGDIVDTPPAVQDETTRKKFNPRFGIVAQPKENLVIRAAYQDWIRPLSTGTLNDVETAGIPLEDRLLEAGGRLKRSVAQVSWTANPITFLSFKVDFARVQNPGSVGVDLRTPSLPFLEQLRNFQTVNLSTIDLLEDTPELEEGKSRSVSIGVNRILTKDLSGYIKYIHQETSSEYTTDSDVSDEKITVTGKEISYIPRHTFVLGSTWAARSQLYASGRLVYRSKRYEDMENVRALPSTWSADLIGMWESLDKHWILSAGALNLGGKKSDQQTERYVVNVRYRF